MLARIVIGIVVGIVALFLAAVAWEAAMERRMDSGPLVERLDQTPIPDEFILVDEWARDGTWFIKSRSPEARRSYLAPGTVDLVCGSIDMFYAERGIEIRHTARTDNPADWCGRTVHIELGHISLWVEPIRSWTQIPPELEGIRDLVEVTYFASR